MGSYVVAGSASFAKNEDQIFPDLSKNAPLDLDLPLGTNEEGLDPDTWFADWK